MTLVACNREAELQEKAQEGLYKYSFILPDVKAEIGDNNIVWVDGDQVGILAGTYAGPADVNANTSPKTVSFTSPTAIAAGTTAYAYFPYDEINDSPECVFVTVSSEQNGASESAMPLAGIPFSIQEGQNNGQILFYNLGSLINFKVFSTDEAFQGETITSIKFEATKEGIAGTSSINLTALTLPESSEFSDDMLVLDLEEGESSVTVSQEVPVAAEKESATPIKMVVLPGSWEGTITVTTDAAVYTKEITEREYVRSQVRTFGLDLQKCEREELEQSYKFVKVTSTGDITDGEYLIVYEDIEVAFDGSLETLDAASNTIDVDITDGIIAATEETEAAIFKIDVTAGTLQSASGYYIGVSSNSNGLKQTEDSETYTHTFSIESGSAVIAAVFDGSTMSLRYNKASNQARFRYYKNAGQEAIQLYKKVLDNTPVVTWTLNSIEVTTAPTKTEYIVGETFDPAGMVVTAYYEDNNGNTREESLDNTALTFEPAGALAVTDTEVTITFNEKTATQAITVTQPTITIHTVEEAIAAAEALGENETIENYYVKGIVCTTGSISSGAVTYYVSADGSTTNRFEMYKGKYIDGASFTAETNLKLGDYVVAKGTLTYYANSSQAELASGNQVVSVFRAPVFSVEPGIYTSAQELTIIAAEGVTIYYTLDGSTPTTSSDVFTDAITLDEDTVVKAFASDGTLSSGVVSAEYTINANANDGSLEKPFTATEARELALAGNTGTYYITGVISRVQSQFSTSYGNSIFWISEDGSEDTFEAYKINYFGDVRWVEGNVLLEEGDEVVINGTLAKYGDIAETSSGYLVSLNGISKALTAGSLQATANNASGAKEITVTWGAASGSEQTISYEVTCGTQTYNSNAAGSHTFTMADYGTYTVSVLASSSDAVSVTVSTAVELADPSEPTYAWILTDLADISSSDVFVIVGNNGSNYAMSNDKGTSSAPTAVAVTVSNGKLSGVIADNIKWNLSVSSGAYTFYPNGSTTTWLYCTNTNNGVRVGNNENKTFTVSDEGYLVHSATSRFVGVYNSQDWRCYTSINSNIKDQSFSFYVYKLEN